MFLAMTILFLSFSTDKRFFITSCVLLIFAIITYTSVEITVSSYPFPRIKPDEHIGISQVSYQCTLSFYNKILVYVCVWCIAGFMTLFFKLVSCQSHLGGAILVNLGGKKWAL